MKPEDEHHSRRQSVRMSGSTLQRVFQSSQGSNPCASSRSMRDSVALARSSPQMNQGCVTRDIVTDNVSVNEQCQ